MNSTEHTFPVILRSWKGPTERDWSGRERPKARTKTVTNTHTNARKREKQTNQLVKHTQADRNTFPRIGQMEIGPTRVEE